LNNQKVNKLKKIIIIKSIIKPLLIV